MSPTAVAAQRNGFHENGQQYHPNPNQRYATPTETPVAEINPGGWPSKPVAMAKKDPVPVPDNFHTQQEVSGSYSVADMEELVSSLPDLPAEQSYVIHATLRNDSLSSPAGVVQVDHRGVGIVPHNIARLLQDQNRDQHYLIQHGALEESFVEKAKKSPQYLAIEEEVGVLRAKVKELEKTNVSETDAKFVTKLKQRPELLGLINLLLRDKKEMATLFLFLGETLQEKNYGLAVASFWKAFEEEFKKCPKALEKILVEAGIQFEEAPAEQKKKSKRGRKKKKATKPSSET